MHSSLVYVRPPSDQLPCLLCIIPFSASRYLYQTSAPRHLHQHRPTRPPPPSSSRSLLLHPSPHHNHRQHHTSLLCLSLSSSSISTHSISLASTFDIFPCPPIFISAFFQFASISSLDPKPARPLASALFHLIGRPNVVDVGALDGVAAVVVPRKSR